MQLNITAADVVGLPTEEQETLQRLLNVYNSHESKNRLKRRYYEGHVSLGEVNLGLALPDGVRDLEIGCSWGEKTVDVLAARSMFDGFVAKDGSDAEAMTAISDANRLRAEYAKAVRSELIYGCAFATLSADPDLGCRIRFHSPESASAEWDGEKGRIGAGLAIIAMATDKVLNQERPVLLHLHTDSAVWELRRGKDDVWYAKEHTHAMGRPLMEPMIWNATAQKPFGRSRLKEPIRRLIQGYVRTMANATIGLEFATSPQKYLLGLTDDQYDAVINQKFRQYIGSILATTSNPETGDNPSFGQLQQGTIGPHVDMIRLLATQFSAATGLSITDTGVINDANPSSSDAILAQSQTLILMAEQLNTGNGDALCEIARMAQAIARNITPAELTEAELAVMPHFGNPAMPSVAATADAAVKISTSRQAFAQTDTFLEMIGFDQADVRRIKAQEQRARGLDLVSELESENV